MNIFIFNSYIPPNASRITYEAHLNAIKAVHSNCRASDIFVLTGDFNIPHASWISDGDSNILLPVHIEPSHAADFIGEICHLGLNQVNHIRNTNNRMLDLIFTNDELNLQILKPTSLVNDIENHHPPILASFEWHIQSNDRNSQNSYRNFKKGNYVKINEFLLLSNLVNRLNGCQESFIYLFIYSNLTLQHVRLNLMLAFAQISNEIFKLIRNKLIF